MENLYDKALEAIQKLFNDTDVSQEETKVNMDSLISEIQIMIDTLDIE